MGVGWVEKGIRNLRYETVFHVLDILMSFCVRWLFIYVLTVEYLGLSGVFSGVLSVLSLAELGIGSVISQSLYKPLADGDREEVAALMNLYRKAYWAVGIFIGVLGVALMPVLPVLIREVSDIPHISWIFLLFVLDTVLPYFFSYKQSLIIADQKRYIVTACNIVSLLVVRPLQGLFLWITRDYFVYLWINIGTNLLKCLVIAGIAGRLYPYVRAGSRKKLSSETVFRIVRNVKGMVFHKLGYVLVVETDNLLISAFSGLADVGLYSNYWMVTNALNTLYNRMFVALTASIGNMAATSGSKRVLSVFYDLNFTCCWLYGFSTVCLVALFNPFIELWLGPAYLFSQMNVCLIAANFYLTGMRQAVLTFRNVYGLYWEDRYKSLAAPAVNLAVSVVLGIPFGVTGIFLGTLASTVAVYLWCEPWILFKHGLNAPAWPYFARHAVNTALTAIVSAAVWCLCNAMPGQGIIRFICQMAVCAVVGNLGFLLFYHRCDEFRALAELAVQWLRRLGKKGGTDL